MYGWAEMANRIAERREKRAHPRAVAAQAKTKAEKARSKPVDALTGKSVPVRRPEPRLVRTNHPLAMILVAGGHWEVVPEDSRRRP